MPPSALAAGIKVVFTRSFVVRPLSLRPFLSFWADSVWVDQQGTPERVIRLWDPRVAVQGGKSSAGQLVGHTDNVKALVMSEDGRYVSPGGLGRTWIEADWGCRCYLEVRIPRSSKFFVPHLEFMQSLISLV